MTSPALDLLLRVAGERLAAERCGRCGGALDPARLRVHAQRPDAVVVEVACAECEHTALVRLAPDAAGS
jgi:hypothetical protein